MKHYWIGKKIVIHCFGIVALCSSALYFMQLARFRILFSKVSPNNIFFAYLLFSLIGVFFHVLWRDEMQGWLVAVESKNILELWENNAPSGHPILYPILVYISSIIYKNPFSMQLMQWLLAVISMFIFLRLSSTPTYVFPGQGSCTFWVST